MSAMQSIEPNGFADPDTRAWTSSGKPQMAYQCKDLDDVLSAVQYQIQTTAQGLIPEEVVCRFQLPSSAILEYPGVKVAERPSVGQDETPAPLRAADGGPIDPDPCPGYSIAAALSNFYDQKEKGNYQKVVAKAVVGAIQYADGFRWTIRRTKDTSTNDGLRFSYACRDSIQKSTRPRKKAGSEENTGTEPTTTTLEKDIYDCKGGIKLIFSIKDLCVDVFYHHVPVHDHANQLDKQRKMQKEAMKANDSPPAPPPNGEAIAANPSITYGFPQQPSEPPKKKRARKKKDEVATSQANGGAFAGPEDSSLDVLADVAYANTYGTYPSIFEEQQYGLFAGQSTSSGESSKAKRPRSTIGCLTCREKRIKCDEQQPTCANCLKSRDTHICEWSNESSKEKPKGTKKTKAKAPATTTKSKAKAPNQQPKQRQQPAKLTKQRAGTGSTASPAKKRKSAPAESSSTVAGRAKPSPTKKSKKAKTTAS